MVKMSPPMDAIAGLLDDALAAGLGSAAAVSVGDGGREIVRITRGHLRRLPSLGPAKSASPGEPGRAATRSVAKSASPGEPGRAATRSVAKSASPGEPG